jgi:hypothetical protein
VLDRYYNESTQLDVALSQRITRILRLYMDALNLNDALQRYCQGAPSRPLQKEHYRWWMSIGVKVDF